MKPGGNLLKEWDTHEGSVQDMIRSSTMRKKCGTEIWECWNSITFQALKLVENESPLQLQETKRIESAYYKQVLRMSHYKAKKASRGRGYACRSAIWVYWYCLPRKRLPRGSKWREVKLFQFNECCWYWDCQSQEGRTTTRMNHGQRGPLEESRCPRVRMITEEWQELRSMLDCESARYMNMNVVTETTMSQVHAEDDHEQSCVSSWQDIHSGYRKYQSKKKEWIWLTMPNTWTRLVLDWDSAQSMMVIRIHHRDPRHLRRLIMTRGCGSIWIYPEVGCREDEIGKNLQVFNEEAWW